MTGRGLVLAAVAAYLAVAGCVVWPEGGPAATAIDPDLRVDERPGPVRAVTLDGLPYRGVAMQVQNLEKLYAGEYEKSLDEIAALGADTVSVVVDARQEDGSSSKIFIDQRFTPGVPELGRLIRYAKEQKKLRVVLMPIVLLDKPRGDEWRGTLNPTRWNEWFDSYRAFILHYANVAEANGVDVLVIGSELVSTEDELEEWTRTIRAVRQAYRGRLTYSANWDHYVSVPFWDQLDLVGMNSYYKLGEGRNVPVPEIVARWKAIQGDLLSFQRRVGKPLILLEAGWCSLANAAHEPWDYTPLTEKVDVELQRKLYEGFFRAWHGNPQLGGFMMWEWPPGEGGPDDRGYTPENKPAAKVLKEWLTKPWDEAKPGPVKVDAPTADSRLVTPAAVAPGPNPGNR